MLASLHASQAYSTLVATGYAMFFGGLLMLGARLGDRYGHRRTILASLSAVTQRRQRPPLVVAEGLALIALADGALIWSPGSAWAVPLCAAAAGAGIGLSSVAATGLGTDVGPRWRGGASGIVNTAAQLGTAVGVAVLLLVAAATSGVPAAGTGPPRVALAVAAVAAAAGAARFAMPGRADRAALG